MNCPLVSVLIVVRNGYGDVGAALDSIRQQDYAPLEVLVVDGMSKDGTRAVVEEYARTVPSLGIRLLDNPGLIQASGWNVGIRAANGRYVLRLDAVHSRLQSNYIRCCLEKILELQCSDPTVAATGGRRLSVAVTGNEWAQAIARAQSSRFGVGNATYRFAMEPGFTDTLGTPLYDRQILLEVDLFDESLGRSEDNELHARLRRRGFKLYFIPDAVAIYRSRNTLSGLASQMFHNGWWVSATIARKHSFPFGVRHLVPFAFYLSMILLAVLSIFGLSFAWKLLCVFLGVYIGASLTAALVGFPGRRFWRVAVVFWLMHCCYSAGTAAGFFAGKSAPSVGQLTAPGADLH